LTKIQVYKKTYNKLNENATLANRRKVEEHWIGW
jgi:hypothetical protein